METKNYWEEFRKECPETIGEKDLFFDLGNYKDWLEKNSQKVYPQRFTRWILKEVY